MLMEKVRAAFSLLMVPFNPGMCRIPDCSAWSGFLVVDKSKILGFQA
jgi:hypothetical protein